MLVRGNPGHPGAAIIRTVLHFLGPHAGVLGANSKRVETPVSRVAVRLAVDHLDDSGGSHDFKEADPEEQLPHGAILHTPIVPVNDELGEVRIPRESVELSSNHANNGEHAHSSVLELRFL